MKKFIYILMIGSVFSLQSCDYIGSFFGNDSDEGSQETNAQDYTDEANDAEIIQGEEPASKTVNLDRFLDKKIDSLTATIDSLKEVVANKDSELASLNNDIKKLDSSKIELKTLYIYLACFTFFIIAAFIFFKIKYLDRDKIYNRVSRYTEDYLNKRNETNSDLSSLKLKVDNIDKKVNSKASADTVNREIDFLKKEVARISDSKTKEPMGFSGNSGTPISSGFNKNFYAKEPSKHNPGAFEDSQCSNVQTEDSLFVFTRLSHNSNKASYVFNPCSQNKLNFALDYHQEFIDPVCDYTESRSGAQLKCDAGEVELKGGLWKVTKRAKIYS